MIVANIDYSDYLGRLAVGRIFSGKVSKAIGARGRAAGRLDRREGQGRQDLHVRGDRPGRRGRGVGGRHHRALGLPGHRDRPDDPGPDRPDAALRHPRGRADALDGVPDQRLADVGAFGQVRHQPPPARAPRERAREERRPADGQDEGDGLVPRARARRALARDPGGDHAPRRLRVLARPAAGDLPPGRERGAPRALRGARHRLRRGIHGSGHLRRGRAQGRAEAHGQARRPRAPGVHDPFARPARAFASSF